MQIQIKRVYDLPQKTDGTRILVDRLWPRGLSKEKARVDFWFKDIAPSKELRKWFGHDPNKWNEFKRRYTNELKENDKQVKVWLKMIKKGKATFVYAAKDESTMMQSS